MGIFSRYTCNTVMQEDGENSAASNVFKYFYVNFPWELFVLKNDKMINSNMYCVMKMIFVNKLR
jgi:hypothetical protein